MRRRLLPLVALAGLAGAGGTAALAAYVSSTSTGVATFTTRAIPSRPVISNTRISSASDCSVAVPADTVRQGGTYYACVGSVTDPAGIASVTADLGGIRSTDDSVALYTAGGPYTGYTYRSAALTADVPLDTGTSGAWSVRATNTNGDRSTLAGNTYNVRSYNGMLLGEFAGPATANVTQYYRLSDTTATAANAGTGGTAVITYNGTPTRRVPGANIGSTDTAVRLNPGGTDYLTANRLAAIAGNYSLEIWVKGSATSGSGPGTVWSDSAGLVDAGTAANANDFGMAVDATGRIVAGCGNGATLRTAAGALTDGEWHHAVFTRVRTTGAIALYLDGALAQASTACNTTNHTGSTTVWFGRSHESDLYLAADLDQPVLYARTITAAEILDHYKLGLGLG